MITHRYIVIFKDGKAKNMRNLPTSNDFRYIIDLAKNELKRSGTKHLTHTEIEIE